MLAKRDIDKTRQELLDAAYQEIHRYGFQAASLSRILAHCQVSKGALYHHFPNKKALGLAVVDEVIRTEVAAMWWRPLQDGDDPLARLTTILHEAGREISEDFVEFGCPLNNIAQEMSPVDEEFRTCIGGIYRDWTDHWVAALQRGQQAGTVRADIDCLHATTFIIAALEGCIGLAKTARSLERLFSCVSGLLVYLDTLRPDGDMMTDREDG